MFWQVSLKEEENFEDTLSNQVIVYGHRCTHKGLNRRQVIQPLLNTQKHKMIKDGIIYKTQFQWSWDDE